jgi:hypothetical protein
MLDVAVCAADDCSAPPAQRGMCTRHYRGLLDLRGLMCDVDGCLHPLLARGFCSMHYQRAKRYGDPGPAEPLIAAPGSGHIQANGYRLIYRPDHPLGEQRICFQVGEHRVVLYDAIGPGPHPCHWCGKQLCWFAIDGEMLHADHLDDDRLHNSIENLAPSCLNCNTKRSHQ